MKTFLFRAAIFLASVVIVGATLIAFENDLGAWLLYPALAGLFIISVIWDFMDLTPKPKLWD